MSIPGKVEYGGAPSTFNLQCIKGLDPQTAQYIADQFNQINEALYLLGNPHRVQDGASVPPTHPPRNRVRFQLQDSLGGGSAPAKVVDGDGTVITTAPDITVYDPMGRYATAGNGDYGIASYIEYPGDTYRLEIDVLGGEGTVTGTANDEKVKISGVDTGSEKYLIDCMANTGTYDAGTDQLVYAEKVNPGGSETMRLFTSSVSATDNYTVGVSGSDTGPNFLKESVATTPQNYVDSGTFNGDNHQKVYFVVEGSGDEKFSLRTKRSEDTGKVKVSTGDGTLEYLYEKFADINTYDSSVHQLVYCDDTGAPRSDMRLFTSAQMKVGVVTASGGIPAATGTRGNDITVGSGSVQVYGHDTGNVWEVGSSETWKNWMHTDVSEGKPVIGMVAPNGDTFVVAEGCAQVPTT